TTIEASTRGPRTLNTTVSIAPGRLLGVPVILDHIRCSSSLIVTGNRPTEKEMRNSSSKQTMASPKRSASLRRRARSWNDFSTPRFISATGPRYRARHQAAARPAFDGRRERKNDGSRRVDLPKMIWDRERGQATAGQSAC